MKISYHKNECGFRCTVEKTEYQQFMGRRHSTLYRGVSFGRHPTKAKAKADALSNLEKVMF